MAQWSNFYTRDECQAEIVVGMYDRWISQIEYGPTAAERALVHTPMMDVAHERRFVVSETKQSIFDFKVTHCRRMEETINYLESHFANHPVDAAEGRNHRRQSEGLIGLAPLPTEATFLDSFPHTIKPMDTVLPPLGEVLEFISAMPISPSELIKTATQIGSPLSVDDSEGISYFVPVTQAIQSFSKQRRLRLSSKRPRQLKAVRTRRDNLRAHGDESDESDAGPHPKRARA